MKKITLAKLVFILLCMPGFLMAQEKNTQENTKCLTDLYNAGLIANNPSMMGSETFKQQLEAKIQEICQSPQRRAVVSIPLVVHVLHNGEPIGTGANISDAQVLSQVTVMNQDFRMIVGTPGESTAGGVDVEVEFVMAQRTPDGCPTNGINRVNICQDGTPSFEDIDYWKTQTIWNRDLYMNMWSSKYVGGMDGYLGFAQFPGGPANTDGVSAGHTYFGSSDYDDGTFQLSAPYDKGRTMTHEVGHYLGLYHTFQGGCGGTGDEVADTPAVDSPNYGCPVGHVSCGTLDMIENYMDYTDDTCMNTYTAGQKVRVQAVLASSRLGLVSSNGADPITAVPNDAEIAIECLSTVPCTTDVNANIKIINWGTSTLTAATISYDVDGADATNYNWTGSLAYGEYATATLPTISASGGTQTLNASIINVNSTTDARACNNVDSQVFSSSGSFTTNEVKLHLVPDNYGSETSWTFSDASGSVLYSGGPYTNGNTTPIDEIFTLTATGCYTFTINDSYGDGMCCNYGNGSYELRTADDTLIFSGGQYGSSEDTSIIVSSLSTSEFELSSTISIYPNPTKNILHIKTTNSNVPDSYAVYNMLGQVVLSKHIANKADLSINTSSLSNGMYFIKIAKESNQVSLPFIKK
ncbi:M43 family zinc metalloprotease [Xanthomarina sp. F2636L]|uniref:M43 family zinc metalloprotease n=1 Tax=Xanthomarina sp. F2636L TaxID=2996018 RepID=UPI00225E4857|nr:M43 family zinc metalloprotease [Xanthomarina sp. F2636L]MCX7551537.1 M43 family zinc metalloprotease [Xanthomarina sp. F2636L]